MSEDGVCEFCGNPAIDKRGRRGRFCNQKCFFDFRKANAEIKKSQRCSQCFAVGVFSMGMCSPCYQKWIRMNGPSSKKFSGKCEHCHGEFFSRKPKIFCSMSCLYSSERFATLIKTTAEKRASEKTCPSCGERLWRPGKKPGCKRFCTKICRRKYYAERFDRWVSSPQGISLPQCYDEFMVKEFLPCLIEGCRWEGENLGVHANIVHGITASELKELAGFNRGTGLVGCKVSEKMSAAAVNRCEESPLSTPSGFGEPYERPVLRPEGREHLSKSSAESYYNGSALKKLNEGKEV